MESNNSSLREVLNNIASIQHELANDQTQLLDSDILMQLKGLAAQLYLESDIELLSNSYDQNEEVEFPGQTMSAPPSIVAVSEEAIVQEVVLEESVTDVVEDSVKDVVEELFNEVTEETVIAVTEETLLPATEGESVQEVVPAFIPEVERVVPPVDPEPIAEVVVAVTETQITSKEEVVSTETAKSASGWSVDSVIGQMPLSRRFEFANILFGGDMQIMGMFIQQFIDAPDAAGRLDVYDQWYEEKQWRRRDESASDMLRMLKRMFAS